MLDLQQRLRASKLQCRQILVTQQKQNCSLLWCLETKKGIVIDPGGDIEKIRNIVLREDVIVERILVTHGHPDHAGGVQSLAQQLSVPICGPHRSCRTIRF